MSVSASLQTKLEQLAQSDSQLLQKIKNLSPEQIAQDPAFRVEHPVAERELEDLSIYQLNAKHKVNAEIYDQLEELWALKELHVEIDVSLENLKNAPSFTDVSVLDTTIQRLQPTLNRLKIFDNKVLLASGKNLAITFSLKEESNNFKSRFLSILSNILRFFVPEPSDSTYTLIGPSEANEGVVSLETFYSLCRDFEVYASVSDITNKLDAIKTTWEKDILEPLMSGRSILELEINEAANCIHLKERPASQVFPFKEYFQSLNGFVSFVNATHMQSIRNHYSTKISNNLVDVISENVEDYMSNEAFLNEELMYTLKLFTNSGWKMPIRNVFVSSDNIRENVHQLYMNWTTNKFLEVLRSLFSGEAFNNDLKNPLAVEQEIQISEPKKRESFPEKVASDSSIPQDENSEASGYLDWDQEWGSDIDETGSKRDSLASDKWSDNWDDNWDEPFEEDTDRGEPSSNLRAIPEDKQAIPESTSHPLPESTSSALNPHTGEIQHHTVVIYQTAAAQKVSAILENYQEVTDGADDQSLLDAIFSLALVSYPPVSESFLFLNDMRAISTRSDYLKNLATLEWSHFCQGLLDESVTAVSNIDFSIGEANEESEADIQEIRKISDDLFAKNLKNTNYVEFRTLILQLFDLINNSIIDIVVGSDEITEDQSDRITQYLEGLQSIEEEALAQINEKPDILSTTDKVIQLKLLINNRLKSIMDYFYQGELFEFSTDELTQIIKAIFIPSELRENCIREIVDIRSA